ncbi:nitrate reductase cytochrome c-type subunit [Litoribacillus peritrichatus]|uniref:Periplasmic nitrate reductase, electron transfer subunit n=1 Tax=Litoribacillus peritrichatus TaxID=718191 RepID=A0ABP7MY71_9GAMM
MTTLNSVKKSVKAVVTGVALVSSVLFASSASAGQEYISTLRGEVKLNQEEKAPVMAKVENEDIKRQRAYPMQPPTIPHKVDNYPVNKNANKCMSCHARDRAEESQAPMVSVTHYMNRDGNFLAEVSPRRYFCNQCHVVQLDTKPLVENEFQDVYQIIGEKK